MFRLLSLVVIILAAVHIIGCKPSPAHTANSNEMGFSVDTNLVNRVVHDTTMKITYRLPSQWTDMTTRAALGKALEADSNNKIRLMRYAGDTSANVMLSLVDIRLVPDSTFSLLKNNYNQLLNGNREWDTVAASDFTKDNFLIQQYVMSNASQVNFRLIFFRQQKPLVQLDFQTMTDSVFATHTKILESIVGSFLNFQ